MLVNVASIVVTVTTGIIGWFAFLNVATLCRATLLARDPVPVRPAPAAAGGVPDHDRARRPSRWRWCAPTLEAALQDPPRRASSTSGCSTRATTPTSSAMCAELGVNHFTRAGVERWNQPNGPAPGQDQARQLQRLARRARRATTTSCSASTPTTCRCRTSRSACSATSATPTWRSSSARRCTATTTASSSAAAESQQFLFHSLLQRAGNRSRTPMLVGHQQRPTLSALRQIGGFQDSITEDMATSLVHAQHAQPGDRAALDLGLHARRGRRRRGARRRSPTTSPSRTAGRAAPTRCWRSASGALGTPARRRARCVHYLLLTCYYPTAAIAWILGAVNAILYFTLGAGGRGRAGAPVADALRRRRGAADRALLLQPPAQRQPAREEGLGRRRRHADLGAVGADLRGLAGCGRAAPHRAGS